MPARLGTLFVNVNPSLFCFIQEPQSNSFQASFIHYFITSSVRCLNNSLSIFFVDLSPKRKVLVYALAEISFFELEQDKGMDIQYREVSGHLPRSRCLCILCYKLIVNKLGLPSKNPFVAGGLFQIIISKYGNRSLCSSDCKHSIAIVRSIHSEFKRAVDLKDYVQYIILLFFLLSQKCFNVE